MSKTTINRRIPAIAWVLDDAYVASQAIASDFSGPAIAVDDFQRGSLNLAWSGYDGINGAINIQVSDDGATWDDWGGISGALINIGTPSGNQPFEFTNLTFKYIRPKFYIGNGTTATIDSIYLLKGDQ